jgi:ubiquinone/menaquinone biosynthesis C-methylase UbiE
MTTPRQPSFDRIARLYRWAEYLSLGPLLQRTRTDLLPHLPPRTHALVLGDGDGRFLAELLQQQPHLEVLAVDNSATMLHLLRQRCLRAAPNASLRTLHTSALALTPDPRTDLIVTHFFLDCLTQPELDLLALRLATPLYPGALWLVSDFAVPAQPLLRPLAALYIRILYLAFRLLTGLRVTHLPNPQSTLVDAGFHRLIRHEHLFGVLYTELWQYR